MNIISRSEWGARTPKSIKRISKTPRVWAHHTAGSIDQGSNNRWSDDLRSIQSYHMGVRGWSDIAYSFLIDKTGQIFEGRGALISGAHTAGDNSKSHAICFIGNYQNYGLSDKAQESAVWLLSHGYKQGWWANPEFHGGHRQAPGASTACPGNHVMAALPNINREARRLAGVTQQGDNEVNEYVRRIQQAINDADHVDDITVDGIAGAETLQAVHDLNKTCYDRGEDWRHAAITRDLLRNDVRALQETVNRCQGQLAKCNEGQGPASGKFKVFYDHVVDLVGEYENK
jgi:hypothetical protein